MLRNSLLALTLSAALSTTTASIPATPVPEATAIKLDGAFTEAIWEKVPTVSDFRQRESNPSSLIADPESLILHPESLIRNPRIPAPDSGFRMRDEGFGISDQG